MKRVLITAPSLDEKDNVSGVVSVTRLIMQLPDYRFAHFLLGRKDNEPSGILWFVRQIWSVFRFILVAGNYDLVHINYSLNPASIIRDFWYALLARRAGKKIVVHVHGGRFLMTRARNPLWLLMIKGMLRLAHRVIVLSYLEAEVLQRFYGNSHPVVLPNAVSFPAHLVVKEKSGSPLRLLFFGRIHNSKGIWDICDAMNILMHTNEDILLDVYGKGPEQELFFNRLRKVMHERFSYKGIISSTEKWNIIPEYDVFILPSRYGEGLPMAMLEAMAAGLAVVVTNDGSVTTVIQNEVNGLIVEKRSPEKLALALQRLNTDRAFLNFLGMNAHKTVEERFTVQNYQEKLILLYNSLLELCHH